MPNLRFFFRAFVGIVFALGQFAESSGAEGPNILFITSDDLGVEVGCYGDRVATTPNIDKLAAEGVKFTRGYVTQASCSPSRSSMLTGTWPHTNGQVGLSHRGYSMFSGEIPTLPKEMKAAGYFTGVIGKIHVSPEDAFPFEFKDTSHKNARDADKVAKNFHRFLKQAGERPWFMMVNFTDPHRPFMADLEGRPRKKVKAEEVTLLPWFKPALSRDFSSKPDLTGKEKEVAGYYNGVNRADEALGGVLEILKKSGAKEKTLVVFIGDHGAPLPGAKVTCYEAGMRIPFLLRWPGHAEVGTEENAMVSTIDLMPTFLEAIGREIPSSVQGRSLLPLLKGPVKDWRKTMGTEYCSHLALGFGPMRTIRDDRYKMIVNLLRAPEIRNVKIDGKTVEELFPRAAPKPNLEIFDLVEDPYEQNNLAGRPGAPVERLTKLLAEWQAAYGDPMADRGYLLEVIRQHADLEKHFTGKMPEAR